MAAVVTVASLPILTSGGRLNLNADFLQYASRHEAVRKSLVDDHALPLRSARFGGGFPTLGDPEDPTLNPLVVLSVPFGAVAGLKMIGFLALLVGALSAYALARSVLEYSWFGSLWSGLVFGTSLFVPLRIRGGNTNEVYAAFLPLCLLLIGLAARGRKIALLGLSLLIYVMLSDGKLTALMALFCLAVLCLVGALPGIRLFGPPDERRRFNLRPFKMLVVGTVAACAIGMARILPAVELLRVSGRLTHRSYLAYSKGYGLLASYSAGDLVAEATGWHGEIGLTTVGALPVILAGMVAVVSWRKALPWVVTIGLFAWLALAAHAPVDLFGLVRSLPIFSAIWNPAKYFSFPIVFALAMLSGEAVSWLRKLPGRWLPIASAIAVLIAAESVLYPRMTAIQSDTYTFEASYEEPLPPGEFFNVRGSPLPLTRMHQSRAVGYFNVLRNIGTLDWYTGVPLRTNAIPKYLVDTENTYLPNPEYRGEAFFLDSHSHVKAVTIKANEITALVDVAAPGTLVINQNHHPDWHAGRGGLFNRNGLLALRLTQIGSYAVHLQYLPWSFLVGLTLSCLSLAAGAAICWAQMSGRLVRWSAGEPGVLRSASRLALACM
ncbi:MAG: hypothetical protein ABL971_06200 [Vicinamibacterales bacterium]